MLIWIMGIIMMTSTSFAQVARVVSVKGNHDSHLIRKETKTFLMSEFVLQAGGEVAANSSQVLLHFFPAGQLVMMAGARIKIVQASPLIVEPLEGTIRFHEGDSKIETQIQMKDVGFTGTRADYEIIVLKDSILMNVYRGEVTVASPHVMTFVPYVVKAKEGFRFVRSKPALEKKDFEGMVREPGFLSEKDLNKYWHNHKSTLTKKQKKP